MTERYTTKPEARHFCEGLTQTPTTLEFSLALAPCQLLAHVAAVLRPEAFCASKDKPELLDWPTIFLVLARCGDSVSLLSLSWGESWMPTSEKSILETGSASSFASSDLGFSLAFLNQHMIFEKVLV